MNDDFEEDGVDIEPPPDVEDFLFFDANSTQQRIVRLLARSMQIAYTHCSPYLEEDFLRQILKALMHLNRIHKKSKLDVGIAEYERIDTYLTNCLLQKNRVFKLHGTQCETYQRVKGHIFIMQLFLKLLKKFKL